MIKRGSFIALRDASGDVVMREITKKRFFRDTAGSFQEEMYDEIVPVADDDLPQVLSDFKEWLLEHGEEC
jgi:hypothetical protein